MYVEYMPLTASLGCPGDLEKIKGEVQGGLVLC
jgi:hypothetical protein